MKWSVKKKWRYILFSIVFTVGILSVISSVLAAPNLREQVNNQIGAGAAGAEFGDEPSDPRVVVASILQFTLGFLGIFLMILVVMSGYWFVTARGNEEKADKATKTIRGAIIGLFIVLSAYGVVTLVGKTVQQAAGQVPQDECDRGWWSCRVQDWSRPG